MVKKLVVFVVGLSLLAATIGVALAQDKPAAVNPKVQDMVAKAKAAVKKVSAETVKGAIDSKEKAVILDVRDPGEFAAGHLPAAVNISRGTLEFNVFNVIHDQDARIYVYCRTGGRAALATKTLNDLGFTNAVLMDAQYADWIKAGYPVER